MKVYRLRQAAARDLLELGRYTQRRWGVVQRRAYVAKLKARLQMLADRAELGARREDVGPLYRSFREARHIIFYVVASHGIDVVRILHERMDVVHHLRAEPGDDDEPTEA